jgi:hypothetical protein
MDEIGFDCAFDFRDRLSDLPQLIDIAIRQRSPEWKTIDGNVVVKVLIMQSDIVTRCDDRVFMAALPQGPEQPCPPNLDASDLRPELLGPE